MLKKINSQDGFTLAELVIVIALIGALAALALGPLKGLWSSGKVSSAVSNVQRLENEVNIYAGYNAGMVNTGGTDIIAAMVAQGVIGTNWTNSDGDTGSGACGSGGGVAHCNPWGGYYSINSVASNVYTISLQDVPQNAAFNMATDFFNSANNDYTGSGTGIYWNGSGLTPGYIKSTVPSSATLGTLTIYFEAA
ncbi:MAG: prepilin-type N-terminal cleavage/methylation domain-containing protein [Deltaproteobacteria bacterium]|nr:prepilin-type N-terminal cleavage/methylation domain-containing protein [Deltaproteobacteria bacterium]MCL5880366.1 prepilin-type N-terminal cleavage/methylation domain-containing protein [Deltaproteobacteria bacterium]